MNKGEKVVKRGGVGNKARGLMVFRIYVEQGGLCAYSGLPLQLEKMDFRSPNRFFKNLEKMDSRVPGHPFFQGWIGRYGG